MINSTSFQNRLVRGVSVDLVIEFTAAWENEGFTHAFGVRSSGAYSVYSVDSVMPDGSLSDAVASHIRAVNPTISRKRFLKQSRRLVRLIEADTEADDAEDLLDMDKLSEVASELEYDEPVREYERV